MDEARDDLLAGARLAEEEGGGVRRRDLRRPLQDLLPRPGFAHDRPASSEPLDLLGEGVDPACEPRGQGARLRGSSLLLGQPLMGEGQRDVVGDPSGEVGVLGSVRVGPPRQEHEPANELSQGLHRHRHQGAHTGVSHVAKALRVEADLDGGPLLPLEGDREDPHRPARGIEDLHVPDDAARVEGEEVRAGRGKVFQLAVGQQGARPHAHAVRTEQAQHQQVVGDDALGDLRNLPEDLPDVEGPGERREQCLEGHGATAVLLFDRPEPLVLERRRQEVGEGRDHGLVLARERLPLTRIEGQDPDRPAAAVQGASDDRADPRSEYLPVSGIGRVQLALGVDAVDHELAPESRGAVLPWPEPALLVAEAVHGGHRHRIVAQGVGAFQQQHTHAVEAQGAERGLGHARKDLPQLERLADEPGDCGDDVEGCRAYRARPRAGHEAHSTTPRRGSPRSRGGGW